MYYFLQITLLVPLIADAMLRRMTVGADGFRFREFYCSKASDMFGARAVAILAANIFQMRRFFLRNETALIIHPNNMTENTLRVELGIDLLERRICVCVGLGAPFLICVFMRRFAGFAGFRAGIF
jgi:hypothetical protein